MRTHFRQHCRYHLGAVAAKWYQDDPHEDSRQSKAQLVVFPPVRGCTHVDFAGFPSLRNRAPNGIDAVHEYRTTEFLNH